MDYAIAMTDAMPVRFCSWLAKLMEVSETVATMRQMAGLADAPPHVARLSPTKPMWPGRDHLFGHLP
jgi:hypothetical protein